MAQAREHLLWGPPSTSLPPGWEARPRRRYKRPLDLVLSAFLLLVTAPLFALIGLLVRCSSRGPVFFSQERLGLDGRTFTIMKFRTMYSNVDSTRHREYFKQYLNGMSAPGETGRVYKLRKDPRITPVGGVLRRLGLDELPQLMNVLRGDMSLVGPRPPLDYEVALYNDRHRLRLSVKPGITGLWQVRGRDVVDFESMVDMDLAYVRTMSLRTDLGILLRTAPSLLWAFVIK